MEVLGRKARKVVYAGREALWYEMWYGDRIVDIDNISCSFSDCDCCYRGNLYNEGKAIGDYHTTDSVTLEKWVNEIMAEKQREDA